MLKSISLENYKCFKEKTDIDIAPLTVLCGVNSSGKSSILKSLLMLKQSAESKLLEPTLLLSGDLVDCGSFDSTINRNGKSKDCFQIYNRFEIYNHTLTATGKYIKKQDAEEFNELKKNMLVLIKQFYVLYLMLRLKLKNMLIQKMNFHHIYLIIELNVIQ